MDGADGFGIAAAGGSASISEAEQEEEEEEIGGEMEGDERSGRRAKWLSEMRRAWR